LNCSQAIFCQIDVKESIQRLGSRSPMSSRCPYYLYIDQTVVTWAPGGKGLAFYDNLLKNQFVVNILAKKAVDRDRRQLIETR
jgi:hypothetical protein